MGAEDDLLDLQDWGGWSLAASVPPKSFQKIKMESRSEDGDVFTTKETLRKINKLLASDENVRPTAWIGSNGQYMMSMMANDQGQGIVAKLNSSSMAHQENKVPHGHNKGALPKLNGNTSVHQENTVLAANKEELILQGPDLEVEKVAAAAREFTRTYHGGWARKNLVTTPPEIRLALKKIGENNDSPLNRPPIKDFQGNLRKDNSDNNLFVSGLPTGIRERTIEILFSRYGYIDKVQPIIIKNQEVGCVFVRMHNAQDSASAMNGLQGFPLHSDGHMYTMKIRKAVEVQNFTADQIERMRVQIRGVVPRSTAPAQQTLPPDSQIQPPQQESATAIPLPRASGAFPETVGSDGENTATSAVLEDTKAGIGSSSASYGTGHINGGGLYSLTPGSTHRYTPRTRHAEACFLILKNLHPQVSQAELYLLFSKYGFVHRVQIQYENQRNFEWAGDSAGFAMVKMDTKDEACAAFGGLRGHILNDLPLDFDDVSWLGGNKPKEIDLPADTSLVFFAHLAKDVTQADLALLFAKYGYVETVRITYRGHTSISRGYGYAKMGSEEAARLVVEKLDGHTLKDLPLKLSISPFKPEILQEESSVIDHKAKAPVKAKADPPLQPDASPQPDPSPQQAPAPQEDLSPQQDQSPQPVDTAQLGASNDVGNSSRDHHQTPFVRLYGLFIRNVTTDADAQALIPFKDREMVQEIKPRGPNIKVIFFETAEVRDAIFGRVRDRFKFHKDWSIPLVGIFIPRDNFKSENIRKDRGGPQDRVWAQDIPSKPEDTEKTRFHELDKKFESKFESLQIQTLHLVQKSLEVTERNLELKFVDMRKTQQRMLDYQAAASESISTLKSTLLSNEQIKGIEDVCERTATFASDISSVVSNLERERKKDAEELAEMRKLLTGVVGQGLETVKLKGAYSKLEAESNTLKAQLANMNKVLVEKGVKEVECGQLAHSNTQLNFRNNLLANENNTLKAEMNNLRTKLNSQGGVQDLEVGKLIKQNNDFKAEISSLKAEIQNLKVTRKTVGDVSKAINQQLRAEIEALQDQLEKGRRMASEIESLRAGITTAKTLREENENLKAEIKFLTGNNLRDESREFGAESVLLKQDADRADQTQAELLY